MPPNIFRSVTPRLPRKVSRTRWARPSSYAIFEQLNEKPHHLPRDREYLLELPPHVRHYEILVNEWGASQ
ncbi:MAG: hypothetical protein K0R40_386 [Burkholderiales bacterium]|jgi:hypothetical protein|nr:hypothetical protein [Burkholderiales bacterium]